MAFEWRFRKKTEETPDGKSSSGFQFLRGLSPFSVFFFISGAGGLIYSIFGDQIFTKLITDVAPEIPTSIASLLANVIFACFAVLGFILEFINQRFKFLLNDTKSSLSKTLTHSFGERRTEKTLFDELHELKESAYLIKNELEGRAHPVRILLFGRLLAYAPLVIAKTENYFADLGLDVVFEYQPNGESDRSVAQGILDGRAEIGVCDPVAALSLQLEVEGGDSALKIIAPVTKQLGATVLIDRTLVNGSEKILPTAASLPDRKFRIAAYAKPSTSFTLARHLENSLRSLFPGYEVEIKPVSISHVLSFLEEIKDCHFVVSWQPHTEYLLHPLTGSPTFEVLTEAHLGVEGSASKAWIAEGPQSMGSAMIAKSSWVKEHPHVLKKVLVAIMLSTMRLEALTAKGSKPDTELAKNLHSELFSVTDAANIDLVERSLARTLRYEEIGRTSLFPFFKSSQAIHVRDGYLKHLANAIKFWQIEDVYSKKTGDLSTDNLKGFFC